MIEIKLKVPSSKEKCNVSDCSVCDLNVLTCGDCEKIWEIGMDRMEPCTSGKETPKVTYEDIKELVEELRKQKEKIERLQKEFIEQALKDNVSPSFSGYTLDTEKGMLLLYETPVSVYPFIDKNTFVFQKDDEEIIKVGLPVIEDSPLVTAGPAKKGTEALETWIERLEERIEVLEKIPMPAPLTQPYPWTPIGPIYCGDIPETVNVVGSSSVPSGKIPIPSEEPLVFYVSAGSSFGEKPLTFHVNEKKDGEWRSSNDEGTIYNLDDKGKKISLKEQIEEREKKEILRKKMRNYESC